MKKLTILLSSILLCSCVTEANKEDREEVKKVKADCEHYKNTPNYINWDLKEDFDKEKSALYLLPEKNPCEISNCSIFAKLKKWNFIEMNLEYDKKNSDVFPYNESQNGLYRIHRDYNFYNELKNNSKNPSPNLKLECMKNQNCITCSSGQYCLVGNRIKSSESTVKIHETILTKSKYSRLIKYQVFYKEQLYIEYNQYIYNGESLYSGLGYGICDNDLNNDIIKKNLFKETE